MNVNQMHIKFLYFVLLLYYINKKTVMVNKSKCCHRGYCSVSTKINVNVNDLLLEYHFLQIFLSNLFLNVKMFQKFSVKMVVHTYICQC